jgi:cell division protein FtsB
MMPIDARSNRHSTGQVVMQHPSLVNASQTPPETISGLVLSLSFWLSLLLAVALFAAVGLSPKLIERARLRDESDAIQFRLVQIEQQNEQLQRVVDAIRGDKEFAAEMARIEFDAVRRDEEIIPVDSALRLSPRDPIAPRSQSVVPRIWYRPLLVPFAESHSLRMSLLGTAAALVLISFTWLQPASARQLARPVGACRSVWQALRSRYVR